MAGRLGPLTTQDPRQHGSFSPPQLCPHPACRQQLSEEELERLEVERVEMIRQHLCQYTQLRHETDMFNQSVSSPP